MDNTKAYQQFNISTGLFFTYTLGKIKYNVLLIYNLRDSIRQMHRGRHCTNPCLEM